MNNFGHQTAIAGKANRFNVGQNWEYIQIVNMTPYLLSCSFEGWGTMDMPPAHLKDIRVRGDIFNGNLIITPSIITTGQSLPPSTTISVNAFGPGELQSPQDTALALQVNQVSNSPQTLFKQAQWHNIATPTVTIPAITGQNIVVEGIDIYFTNDTTGTLFYTVDCDFTIGGAAVDIPYRYTIFTKQFQVDHPPLGRGILNDVGQPVSIVVTQSATSGNTQNDNELVVRYHYETLY